MSKTNFQPMPKRFMVWSKKDKRFLELPWDNSKTVFDDFKDLGVFLEQYALDDIIIIQSTNLFDKDGKEIFEGSILSSHSGDLIGVAKQHKSGEWRIWWYNIEWGSTTINEPSVYPLALVGHILSNLEILA